MKMALIRILNKLQRGIKNVLLNYRIPVLTGLYFRFLSLMDVFFSPRRLTKQEQLTNLLWKQRYFYYYQQHPQQRYRLKTAYSIAYESDDHKFPRGSVMDSSQNYRFNLKVYSLFAHKDDLSVLDLGCSGGAFVKSVLEDGYAAAGLEGSDVSQRMHSGEWDTIPYHLFTCNIVKPFQIFEGNGKKSLFDMITSWEVLEHIAVADLDQLAKNIRAHLKPGGYFVGSVDMLPDGNPLTGAVYHVTLKPRSWWEEAFSARGLKPVKDHPFESEDMVRGSGLTVKDWHPSDGTGFHLVLKKS